MQPFQSFIVNASQQITLSGNPTLDSEIAESLTYGVVLNPRFLDGFTASVDWFDIEIANAIENLTAVDILRACYDSSAFPAEPSCDLFERDGAGQIADVSTGFVNVGLVEFAGLQTNIAYLQPLGNWGDLNLSLTHLYTEQHLETPGSGNTLRLDGQIGESKDRVTASAIWSYSDWQWFNQLRWISSAVFDNSDSPTTRSVSGVGDWTTWDTSVAYAINDDITVQVNIDNVLDNEAPYPAVASAFGETTYFSGILERYASITLRARF